MAYVAATGEPIMAPITNAAQAVLPYVNVGWGLGVWGGLSLLAFVALAYIMVISRQNRQQEVRTDALGEGIPPIKPIVDSPMQPTDTPTTVVVRDDEFEDEQPAPDTENDQAKDLGTEILRWVGREERLHTRSSYATLNRLFMTRLVTGTQPLATRFYEQFGERVIRLYDHMTDAGKEDVEHKALYYEQQTVEQVRALANRLIEIGDEGLVSIEVDRLSWGKTTARDVEREQSIINVLFTVEVEDPPVNVTDLQLRMGDEPLTLVSSTIPSMQKGKRGVYEATFALSYTAIYADRLARPEEEWDTFRLWAMVNGQEWASEESSLGRGSMPSVLETGAAGSGQAPPDDS